MILPCSVHAPLSERQSVHQMQPLQLKQMGSADGMRGQDSGYDKVQAWKAHVAVSVIVPICMPAHQQCT
jgi:hypothetical protein